MTYGFLRRRMRLALVVATALLSLAAITGTASAKTATFSNPAAIDIPDTSPASPYPSTINVSGFNGNVQKVTATLHGFTHTCPDDIAVLLVGPSGANSVLMGQVGGCGDTGVIDLTFDESAPRPLNDSDTATAGTYVPAESSTTVLSPPAPTGPHPVNLNAFNGTPANGTWQLFIEDQVSGDFGAVTGGWSLNVTAPVNTITTGKPKVNTKNGTALVPVTVPDAGELEVGGKGVRSSSASKSSVTAGGPGTTNLKVKPNRKTNRKLNATGRAKVTVKITFTPNGGTPSVTTKKFTLKKTL